MRVRRTGSEPVGSSYLLYEGVIRAVLLCITIGGGGVHVEQPGSSPIQRTGRRSLSEHDERRIKALRVSVTTCLTGCWGNSLVTLAAGRCFSGLSPFEDDDVCLSRDWPVLGQSGLDDIMLPEGGRAG